MFPLQTVLVPHAPLSLHVFEPRYRALMDDVFGDAGLGRASPAGSDHAFGVVLIERGSEVGGGDRRTALGTVAVIAEAMATEDGRWGVVALGRERIDVVEWLDDDPYPQALVSERPEPAWPDGVAAAIDVLVTAERAVRWALGLKGELGEAAAPATIELDARPAVAAWQLVHVAPLQAYDRQRLLGVDDPIDRLRLLRDLADDESVVLAQRRRGLGST